MKQKLNDILLKYDNQMFRLQNLLEDVKQILEKEKHELEQYKVFDLVFMNIYYYFIISIFRALATF